MTQRKYQIDWLADDCEILLSEECDADSLEEVLEICVGAFQDQEVSREMQNDLRTATQITIMLKEQT